MPSTNYKPSHKGEISTKKEKGSPATLRKPMPIESRAVYAVAKKHSLKIVKHNEET